jgi:hypothetical protein
MWLHSSDKGVPVKVGFTESRIFVLRTDRTTYLVIQQNLTMNFNRKWRTMKSSSQWKICTIYYMRLLMISPPINLQLPTEYDKGDVYPTDDHPAPNDLHYQRDKPVDREDRRVECKGQPVQYTPEQSSAFLARNQMDVVGPLACWVTVKPICTR